MLIFFFRYLFPRQLLCQHFWTLQQRIDFAIINQRKKLYNYKPVFRYLQAQLDTVTGKEDHDNWAYILGLLGSGLHPKPNDIIRSAELFRGDPYHFSYLYPGHVVRFHHWHLINWKQYFGLFKFNYQMNNLIMVSMTTI